MAKRSHNRRAYLGVALPGPLFRSPNIVMTPGAEKALKEANQEASEFLKRHFEGDWGDIDKDDAKANNESVKSGGMILSSYKTKKGEKIWVITDPGHEVTTVLLPEEY